MGYFWNICWEHVLQYEALPNRSWSIWLNLSGDFTLLLLTALKSSIETNDAVPHVCALILPSLCFENWCGRFKIISCAFSFPYFSLPTLDFICPNNSRTTFTWFKVCTLVVALLSDSNSRWCPETKMTKMSHFRKIWTELYMMPKCVAPVIQFSYLQTFQKQLY